MLVKERQSWLGISQQQKWHIQVICHMICMKWFESYRLKQSIQLSWSYKHFCKSLVLSLCRFSSPVCVTCFLEMLQRCYEGYLFHRNHLNSSGRSFWTKTSPRLAFFSDIADNKCLKKLAFWIVWWVHLDVHSFFHNFNNDSFHKKGYLDSDEDEIGDPSPKLTVRPQKKTNRFHPQRELSSAPSLNFQLAMVNPSFEDCIFPFFKRWMFSIAMLVFPPIVHRPSSIRYLRTPTTS